MPHVHLARSLLAALTLCAAATGHAAEGVIEINQVRALAGSVTPGDTPGFPVTLSQPGSYRMTSNLIADGSTDVVVIKADNVTLDMNGFAIMGPRTCTGTPVSSCTNVVQGTGVRDESVASTELRNGTVSGMHRGVYITTGRIDGVRVHDNNSGLMLDEGTISNSHAFRNLGTGISVTGSGAVVTHSTAYGNGGDGIVVQFTGTVIDSISSRNGGLGIEGSAQASARAVLSRNVIRQNGGGGIAITYGVVSQNQISLNAGHGVYVAVHGVVNENSLDGNSGSGIRGDGVLTMRDNYLAANNGGYHGGAGTRIQTGPNACGTILCP